jgi:fatty acid desaturase
VDAPAEVCLLNIGPKERTKRMRFGAVSLALAVLALGALMVTGASPWWSVLLFVPFAGATSGYFQARRKT